MRAKTHDLERLVQELRPIERLMLEAFPNLVAPRLKEDRLRFEEAIGDGGEALLTAIEERLQAANEIGSQFSLQTMPDTNARLFDAMRGRDALVERRATVHVRLSFGAGEIDASYESTITQLQSVDRATLHAEIEALKGRPAKIFALAAMLAFRLEIWKDAVRYSGLAATASIEQTKYVERLEVAPAEHYEYTYLMAAALRFQLASFEPMIGYTYSDPWGKWLRNADEALLDCVAFHMNKGQLTRAMRARSERAAIHISFCEWFAFGKLADPSFYQDPEDRALESFRVVVTELRDSEEALRAAEVHAVLADGNLPDAPSQTMLAVVRRQFRSNVHAALMTARRFGEVWPKLDASMDALVSILPKPHFDDDWPEGPSIARAYSAAVRRDREALAAVQAGTLTLPLDRVVLTGLRQICIKDQA